MTFLLNTICANDFRIHITLTVSNTPGISRSVVKLAISFAKSQLVFKLSPLCHLSRIVHTCVTTLWKTEILPDQIHKSPPNNLGSGIKIRPYGIYGKKYQNKHKMQRKQQILFMSSSCHLPALDSSTVFMSVFTFLESASAHAIAISLDWSPGINK